MNFQHSLEYLYGLGNEVSTMKLGLDNIKKLLTALGNPEKKYLKVQIAGTNGKGSTCAFLQAICVHAGIKTGLTTSPHLINITERIKIGNGEISKDDFARHATKIRQTSEKLVDENELETVPTFFEQITAIALVSFAEAEVELAILETGLGGRFDAMTAASAEIVAITPIDFDHQQILGNTLAKIAAEKAAIIREDTRVIAAPQKKEAEKVIVGKCREKGVELIWATTKIKTVKRNVEVGFPIESAYFVTGKRNYPDIVLGLEGRHQLANASVAISIAEVLQEFGFKITDNDIGIGLQTAEHKGRLEFYQGFLFDGAHNIAGAKALENYLNEFVQKPITMIFGAMRDKDLREIADILFSKADILIFTKPDNDRSVEIEDLIKFLPADFNRQNVFTTEIVSQAIEKAKEISPEKSLILVTGSLYLIGEVQKRLKETILKDG